MKKAELQLEQLTCPSCVKKIESTLSKTSGIDSVKVMFNSSKVKTEFDESKIDAEQIQALITRLGYDVLKTKIS